MTDLMFKIIDGSTSVLGYTLRLFSLMMGLVAVTLFACSITHAMETTNVWGESDAWFASYTNCLKNEGSIACKRHVPKMSCIAKTNDGLFAFQVVSVFPSIAMDERWARGGYCGETFGCYPPYEIEFISPCSIERLPQQ